MPQPHLIIDAMNVIGARPDGWWRDRAAAVRKLVKRLQHLAEADGAPMSLVVDGRALKDLEEGPHGGVYVLYARRAGANAADDRIVELVGVHPEPSELAVVTSDRELSQRVTAHGAHLHTPSALLRRLDEVEQ